MAPATVVGSSVAVDNKSPIERYSAHILELTAAENSVARPSSFEADLETNEISIREENVVVASVHGDLSVPSVIQMPSGDDYSITTRTSDCTVSYSSEAATLDSQQLTFLTRQSTNGVHRLAAAPQLPRVSPSPLFAPLVAGETWAACDLASSVASTSTAAAPQRNVTNNNNNASNHNEEAAVSEQLLWQRIEEMILRHAAARQHSAPSALTGRATSSGNHGYAHHLLHHPPLPPLHESWRSEFPSSYHHANHYHQQQHPSVQVSQYARELEEPMPQWHHPSLQQQHVRRQISSSLPTHHHHIPSSHVMPELFHHNNSNYPRGRNTTNLGDHHRYSWSESVPHPQAPPSLSARYSWPETAPQHPQAPPPLSDRFSWSESVPQGPHLQAPSLSAPGNHPIQPPSFMTSNTVAVVVPPVAPTTTTTTMTDTPLNDRDVIMTLADMLRDQAQRRARIGWAEQLRYPREPDILESEQHHHILVVDPDVNADNAPVNLSRPERQPPRDRAEGGQEMPEPPAYNVLAHRQTTGRCRDPPELRNIIPRMVAPDPPVSPSSPLLSPALSNRSEVTADSDDMVDVHLNVALVQEKNNINNNKTAERLESSSLHVKDALIPPKDLARKSSDTVHSTLSSPEKKRAAKTAGKDSKTSTPQLSKKSSETALAAPPPLTTTTTSSTTTTPRREIQCPVRNFADSSSNNSSNIEINYVPTEDDFSTASMEEEDWNPQGPVPAALLRLHRLDMMMNGGDDTMMNGDDSFQVSIDILPGAVRVPGINATMDDSLSLRDDSFITTTTTIDDQRRLLDLDSSHLISATLVEDSEIETMNFLRQLRQDLDQVVQHLHKDQSQQQDDVTRRNKWFSPLRGIFPPRRRKTTGML